MSTSEDPQPQADGLQPQADDSRPQNGKSSSNEANIPAAKPAVQKAPVRKPGTRGTSKSKAATAKSTNSKAKTATAAPKPKPPTEPSGHGGTVSDFSHRITRLEKLVERQAADNDSFRQTIMAAVTGQLIDHDDGASTNFLDQDSSDVEFANSDMPILASIENEQEISLENPLDDTSSTTVSASNILPSATYTAMSASDSNSKHIDRGFAASFAVDADMGDSIRNDVATSLNFALVEKLEEKCVQEAVQKYKCPKNCEALVVPKVNPQIWENINAHSRSRDLKLQRVQKPLIKGITALAKACEGPCTVEQEHGFLLLATANFELNCLRKELIKPDLNPRYAHLCKPSNKVTSQLFGEDLGKQIKEMQDEQKATFGVLKHANFAKPGQGRSRYQPYPKTSNSRFQLQAALAGWKSNSTPFLGGSQSFSRYNKGKPNSLQFQGQRRKSPSLQRQEFPKTSPAQSKK